MKVLDLRYGNPAFMQPYWERVPCEVSFDADACMDYLPGDGLPDLKRAIERIHGIVGNADTKNQHIVVGCGATQLIYAALDAFRGYQPDTVFVRPPHFFRFPSIIAESNYHKATGLYGKPGIEILTYPSNPDNVIYPAHRSHRQIFDLCYGWPQYGTPQVYDGDAAIFSLAKATGHAASRIGWAVVPRHEIATRMRRYIEHTTGGVSVEAQDRATALLDFQSDVLEGKYPESTSCFQFGKSVLDSRWQELEHIKKQEFEILNGSGMFAWCRYKNGNAQLDLLKDLNISGSYGPLSGGSQSHVRLNVGCSDQDFKELLSRLQRLL